MQADSCLYPISQLHEWSEHGFVRKRLPAGHRAIQQYTHEGGLIACVDDKLVSSGCALLKLVHHLAHLIRLELQRFQERVG